MDLSKLIKVLAIILMMGGAAACNTMKGAGEDIEQGGEAVTESAEDVEDEIDD